MRQALSPAGDILRPQANGWNRENVLRGRTDAEVLSSSLNRKFPHGQPQPETDLAEHHKKEPQLVSDSNRLLSGKTHTGQGIFS